MSDARIETAARWFAAEDGYTPEHYARCTDAHKDEWRSDARDLLAAIDAVERGLADQLAAATQNLLDVIDAQSTGIAPQLLSVAIGNAMIPVRRALAARGSSVRTHESASQ